MLLTPLPAHQGEGRLGGRPCRRRFTVPGTSKGGNSTLSLVIDVLVKTDDEHKADALFLENDIDSAINASAFERKLYRASSTKTAGKWVSAKWVILEAQKNARGLAGPRLQPFEILLSLTSEPNLELATRHRALDCFRRRSREAILFFRPHVP